MGKLDPNGPTHPTNYAKFTDDLYRAGDNEHTDKFGRYFGFAGGWEVWQFGWENKPPEIFADMYLGWAYGAWDYDHPQNLGARRSSFMKTTMNGLIVSFTSR